MYPIISCYRIYMKMNIQLKLTPLTLFLILLLVLVISILFSKYFPLNEGFITFAEDKTPLEPVYIPTYSSNTTSVVKLYDNMFFDMRNANLIEIDGTVVVSPANNGNVGNVESVGNVGNVAPSSTTISKVYVLPREELTIAREYTPSIHDGVVVPVDTPESQIPTTSSIYLSKMYNTHSHATDKYQVAYITWGTRTYMHMISLGTVPKHISSFLMGEDSAGIMKTYPESSISIGPYVDDSDSNNGKYIVNPVYDPSINIYQLSKSVQYDKTNGNLVIFNKTNNSVKVYGRNGAETTTKPTSVSVSTFEPWLVNDADNNMVVYMPHDKKTLLMILQMDPANSSKFILGRIARFNNTGDLEDGLVPPPPPATAVPAAPPTTPTDNGPLSEYYKWLAYWSTHVLYEDQSADDYIRKTQIVPPVCPSCPSCPSCATGKEGVCANCGGNGGSGTLLKDGSSVVKQTGKVIESTVQKTGDVVERVVSSTGDVAEKAISTTGDVIKTTGGEVSSVLKSTATGTTDLLKSAGTGTTDLLKSTATGTTDLLKSAASGTTDLLKSAGRGTTDLLRSAGTGTASLLSPSNSMYRESTIYPQGSVKRTGETQRVAPVGMYRGQSLGPSNYYTQYGALQPKGDNFIPITADFSAFRK